MGVCYIQLTRCNYPRGESIILIRTGGGNVLGIYPADQVLKYWMFIFRAGMDPAEIFWGAQRSFDANLVCVVGPWPAHSC